MATRSVRLGALAIVALLTGCCTAMGCANELRLHVPADLVPGIDYDVSICLDEACDTATLHAPNATTGANAGPLWLWTDDDTIVLELGDGPFRSNYEVSFTLRDEAGDVIARFDGPIELVESQPNGPFCEPTCWSADIGMEPAAGS